MKVLKILKVGFSLLAIASLVTLTGCSNYHDVFDPFHEDLGELETKGSRDTRALLGNGGAGGKEDQARKALEVMGTYRRAQAPQPANPVIQPAEVRLMWVPDHLNKIGDLVPAHYYYLRVLNDRWAAQDSFELEEQLNVGSSGGATPWVYSK